MPLSGDCQKLSLFCRAFSNRLRLNILCILREGEKNVTQIVDIVEESKHNVSQQLKYLRLTGILKQRKDGRNRYYSLDNKDVVNLLESTMKKLENEKYSDFLDCLD